MRRDIRIHTHRHTHTPKQCRMAIFCDQKEDVVGRPSDIVHLYGDCLRVTSNESQRKLQKWAASRASCAAKLRQNWIWGAGAGGTQICHLRTTSSPAGICQTRCGPHFPVFSGSFGVDLWGPTVWGRSLWGRAERVVDRERASVSKFVYTYKEPCFSPGGKHAPMCIGITRNKGFATPRSRAGAWLEAQNCQLIQEATE